MKRFTVFLAVIVLVLLTVAVAFAAPPVTESFEYDDTYPMLYCGDGPPFYVGVGDFWIWNNEVGEGSYTEFYDNDGNLVGAKGHVNGTDHLFAEGYPEHMLSGQFTNNWMTYFDPATGLYLYENSPSNWWNLHLPGYGNIIHFAGLEVYEYDNAIEDWHLIKDNGLRYFDLVALCEYLAPPG